MFYNFDMYIINMNTWNEFRKMRRIQLQQQHPNYSPKIIQKIIQSEWKKERGSGSCITSRKTTLQYEVIKTLINRVSRFDISTCQKVCDIVNSKSCSYCPKHLERKSTGDHFIPVALNSKAPILCNFSFLTIPCCQECNSKKGKKTWQTFTGVTPKISAEQLENLKFLQEFIDANIKHYQIDQDAYDKVMRKITDSLERLRQATELMSFVEIND
jgi:5-methylcytosine-specific restriction endonuclease McrA